MLHDSPQFWQFSPVASFFMQRATVNPAYPRPGALTQDICLQRPPRHALLLSGYPPMAGLATLRLERNLAWYTAVSLPQRASDEAWRTGRGCKGLTCKVHKREAGWLSLPRQFWQVRPLALQACGRGRHQVQSDDRVGPATLHGSTGTQGRSFCARMRCRLKGC